MVNKWVVTSVFDKTGKHAPHYLHKNREMVWRNPKAFFKTKGEFTKVYDMAQNHRFIGSPFGKQKTSK